MRAREKGEQELAKAITIIIISSLGDAANLVFMPQTCNGENSEEGSLLLPVI